MLQGLTLNFSFYDAGMKGAEPIKCGLTHNVKLVKPPRKVGHWTNGWKMAHMDHKITKTSLPCSLGGNIQSLNCFIVYTHTLYSVHYVHSVHTLCTLCKVVRVLQTFQNVTPLGSTFQLTTYLCRLQIAASSLLSATSCILLTAVC